VLEQYTPQTTTVLPANIANDMNAMLSDNPARVPEYALNSPLYFPGYDVAVKTGTTNDTRDAWVIGYTPSIAIGVWAGNNDNTPMVKSIAGFIAAPMWHDVMAYALTKYPKTYFNTPDPISTALPPVLRGDWQIPDATGAVVPHDLLYWTSKTDPQGPAPETAGATDPQYAAWEYGVQAWYASHPGLFVNPPLMVPLSAPVIAPIESTTTFP
jgi:membrane peptidoglycan carboxypeptidase